MRLSVLMLSKELKYIIYARNCKAVAVAHYATRHQVQICREP